jgi:hypothetical protein
MWTGSILFDLFQIGFKRAALVGSIDREMLALCTRDLPDDKVLSGSGYLAGSFSFDRDKQTIVTH